MVVLVHQSYQNLTFRSPVVGIFCSLTSRFVTTWEVDLLYCAYVFAIGTFVLFRPRRRSIRSLLFMLPLLLSPVSQTTDLSSTLFPSPQSTVNCVSLIVDAMSLHEESSVEALSLRRGSSSWYRVVSSYSGQSISKKKCENYTLGFL